MAKSDSLTAGESAPPIPAFVVRPGAIRGRDGLRDRSGIAICQETPETVVAFVSEGAPDPRLHLTQNPRTNRRTPSATHPAGKSRGAGTPQNAAPAEHFEAVLLPGGRPQLGSECPEIAGITAGLQHARIETPSGNRERIDRAAQPVLDGLLGPAEFLVELGIGTGRQNTVDPPVGLNLVAGIR